MNVKYGSCSKFKHYNYPDDKFLEATRVICSCGHVVNFVSRIPYIICTHCGNIIFRNKKCEFDFKVKRKVL